MTKRSTLFFPWVIISVFFVTAPLFAQVSLDNPGLPKRTGFKIGDRILLHGAMKAQEELETNIFLTKSKEKFDAITLLNPSVGIEIPIERNKLSFDYDAGIYLYGRHTDQNHIDHRARGLAEINLTDYKVTIKDVFRNYTDRAADENSVRVARKINVGRAGVAAEFGKLGFDAGYTNIWEAYGSRDDRIYQQVTYKDRDRMTNVFDGALAYRILPKTQILLQSNLGFVHYYNSSIPPDSWFLEALGGLRGRLTNKVIVNGNLGLRYQSYDKSGVYHDKYFFGPVARGGLDFAATKDDLINFSYEMTVFESLYANMNYYDSNLMSLRWTHKFNDKMSLGTYGSYQLSLYPSSTTEGDETGKRYDNVFVAGLKYRYDIRKWLSTEMGYEYARKISKFSTFDYVDNRIFINGTAGF